MDSMLKIKRLSLFLKLASFMENKKVYIPIAMILSFLSSLLNVLPFYYIWKISKEILANENDFNPERIKHYALMVFICSVAGILSYFATLLISHLTAFEIEKELKKIGFEKAMKKPLGFHQSNASGKIRTLIYDGASSTHVFLAHQLPDFASSIVTPLMVLFLFMFIDWRLGLAGLIPILLSFFMMSKMMNEERKVLMQKYMDSLEKMSSESVEYVRAIPVVKTFGQSVKSFTRFYNAIQGYKELVITWTKMLARPYALYLVLLNSTALFLIPIAIFLIGYSGSIGSIVGDFILYLLVAPQLAFVMTRSVNYTNQKFAAEQAIDRFNQLFDDYELVFPEVGAEFNNQTIEFKEVCFSYDGQKSVLNGINFKVERGQTLALVGPSGSGKTTIARLAARFWDVSSGEILIGGLSIKDYTKEELMNNISFVFQNNKLFKMTLRDNICFGRMVCDEAIEDALVKSRAKSIIDKLEDGLDTTIGKKGTYLSGGEQQRIALARVFIKNAPIVLLDEATAFADPENEHLIQAALKELSKGKTTIMIAHRMTTVRDADHIAVVDHGRIIEYGNHETLMEEDGQYKQMWDEYQASANWRV